MTSEPIKMKMLLLVIVMVSIVSAQNRPPAISLGPEKELYYSGGTMLPCTASGTPAPWITWYKNGQEFNLNEPGVRVDGGNLTLPNPSDGFYQCTASSSYGMALSNVAWLRQAKTTSVDIVEKQVNARVGDTLTLPCTLGPGQQIVPSVHYRWQTVQNRDDVSSRDIVLDRRVQVDDNGTLTFASVVTDDNQNNRYYRCHLTNRMYNNIETSVAYTKVNVSPAGSAQPTQLTNLFSYSWPKIALERNSVSLRCFFGGAADTVVSWKKPDGSEPSGDRYTFDTTQLRILNVQKSDEGVYTCTGTSSRLPMTTATINLKVESAPYFLTSFDGPHDVNVTNGGDVAISCNAYAIPNASVVWFLNGNPLDSNQLPAKFKLSSDKKTLTISKVCKRCPEGTVSQSDLMVIQCNASNSHGYMFGNGYINVLEPTVITTPPEDVLLDFPNPVIFTCEATSDETTQINYFWTLAGNVMYNGLLNTSIPGLLYIDVAKDQESKGVTFVGRWTCNATNGVSSDAKSAQLSSDRSPYPGIGAVVSWWWIPFLIILLLLLAILLIFIICCCLYQNRGEAYPVDEEERKGGNDPVKELQEIGFHDFQRPVDAPDGLILQTPLERGRRGQGSISSSIGKTASDDEMSLDNYSNINHGKFTEDGSFIGQYVPNSRRKIQMQPGIPESTA